MGMETGPNGGAEPRKSRKKFWIFGGLGCMGVIGICCIGIVSLVMLYVYRPMQEFQNENVSMATNLPEVELVLGSPVTAGPVSQVSDGAGAITFSAPLTGPNGEGKLFFQGKPGIPLGQPWVRESFYFEFDGERTDLDAEALFDIDIDDGL